MALLVVGVTLGLGPSSARAQEPGPSGNAAIDRDAVSLNNWTPASSVTLSIGGVSRTLTVDGGGNAWLDRQMHGQDVVAGMTLTATD